MQADAPDPVPASSPQIAPVRPTAAPLHERGLASHDGLRRRRSISPPAATQHSLASTSTPTSGSGTTLRIHLQTPHADLGGDTVLASGTRSPGWDVRGSLRVADVKDAIADGRAGYGHWERSGLRLVWRGRMLADDELVGIALKGADSPTLLLVARPIATRIRPTNKAPPASSLDTHANGTSPYSTTAAVSAMTTATSPEATALADTVHYVLFLCREHLAVLLGAPVLQWQRMHPTPIVSRAEARTAVQSVVRAYAEPHWEWEGAFAGDGASLKDLWVTIGAEGLRNAITKAWTAGMGSEYGSTGEKCRIELDHTVYDLYLPALQDMVPSQLINLLLYLRTADLAARLSGCLTATAQATPAPEPTHTVPTPTPTAVLAAPQARIIYRGSIQLRVPRISFALLTHLFWSAMRIATILWMITRGMHWDDMKFWLLFGGCLGWWVVDGYNHWVVEQREERVRAELRARRLAAEAEAEARERGLDPAGNVAPMNAAQRVAADAPLHAAAAARAGAGEIRQRQPRRRGGQDWNSLVFYHLDVDRRQLRLPRSSVEQASRTAGGPAPPAHQNIAPRLRHAPSSRPAWWMTQIFLRIYLWFITLIPAFEVQRARTIRRRERAMRAVITGLNPEVPVTAAGVPLVEETPAQEDQAQGEDQATPSAAARELVFPDSISPAARAYYARIAGTPEAIDWEEERDAQRAMGIPDEEDARAGFAGLL